MCDLANAASGVIDAVKICSGVASCCRFKIKSPGLIRSEGRPAGSMRRRVRVSHAPSKIQHRGIRLGLGRMSDALQSEHGLRTSDALQSEYRPSLHPAVYASETASKNAPSHPQAHLQKTPVLLPSASIAPRQSHDLAFPSRQFALYHPALQNLHDQPVPKSSETRQQSCGPTGATRARCMPCPAPCRC